MYFSLVPDPGYNNSYLETCGVAGEFWLFHGWFNNSAWVWGGNCSIEGRLIHWRPEIHISGLSLCLYGIRAPFLMLSITVKDKKLPQQGASYCESRTSSGPVCIEGKS